MEIDKILKDTEEKCKRGEIHSIPLEDFLKKRAQWKAKILKEENNE